MVTESRPKLYKALFTFVSDQPGELSLEEGEIIHVTKREGDWWIGSVGERTGTFPGAYVKEVEIQVRCKTVMLYKQTEFSDQSITRTHLF